jgi:hypothetical protein
VTRRSGTSGPGVIGVAVALMLLTVFAGCGRRPRLVKVTGTVTFAGGKPPLGGLVMFLPEEGEQPMRPGLGSFDREGTLRVSSFRDSDGLRPGRYRVELRCVSETGNSHDTMTAVDHVPEGFTPPELIVPPSGSVVYTIDVPKKSAAR